MKYLLRITSFATLLAATCAIGSADILTLSLADYNGAVISTGFPIDLGTVGTFNYAALAGADITSATFSGTYGDTAFNTSTASYNAVIAGQTIVVCAINAPCFTGVAPALTPFSFSLDASTFATLETGSVPLDLVQESQFVIRLGAPTLTIDYTPVPEPSSVVLLGMILLGSVSLFRKRLYSR